MSLRVAWLPAHPSGGAVSMLRYWRALRRSAAEAPSSGVEIVEALAPPSGLVPCRPLRRTWHKYVAYPCRLQFLPRCAVYHLLDHGYAHLVRWLPAGARVVASIHDLAPLDGDEGLTATQVARFRRALRRLARAQRIVVPSAFTAGRVAQHLGIPAGRCTVLPMGVDRDVFRPQPDVRPTPWIVSVGGATPRKNLGLLPAVVAAVAARVPAVRLVRVGDPLPAALRRELAGVLGGRLEERGAVDDAALARLYAGALALLLPSRYEGFGLPVLEAMACGCPVVCARTASLPEVGGAAALYFAPDDPAAAAGHLVRLATDVAFTADRAACGAAWAERFSWAAYTARLMDLYREVVR